MTVSNRTGGGSSSANPPTTPGAIDHPFYPRTLLLPHFAASEHSMATILSVFFAAIAVVVAAAWRVSGASPAPAARRNGGALPTGTRLVLVWFVFCSGIHGVVEGYYAYNNRSIAAQTTFFADMWKEYAISDSRYMTEDAFVAVMESMTAILWGPLSLVAAYMIWRGHPSRHLLQFLISTGQLYGDVAYYGTAFYDDLKASSPHPYYFWFYFFGMNFVWIVIPSLVMLSSGAAIVKALRFADDADAAAAPKQGKRPVSSAGRAAAKAKKVK
ncbi:EBP domain-containing protein [Zopfochytrium polystomum]|nr:EBP domain-containing protein [Zopfochytrium polystomum]